jgi:hypothetical protein
MEFGLFHEFQDTSEAEAFSQSFALVNAAEQWGLDANFAPDRWVLASPLILAAAIAQRTRRMKSWRLSNGPGPRSASRTAENILRTTKWHWCRSHARSHPYPPIRIAATSIDTYAAIGKLGHAIFDASIAPRGGTLHDGKYAVLVPQEMIATPRTAAAAHGMAALASSSRLVREAQRERAGSIEPAARASGGPDRDRDAQPSGAEERHVGRSGGRTDRGDQGHRE